MNARGFRLAVVLFGAVLLPGTLPAVHGQTAPVERYVFENPGSDLVGEIRSASVREGQTLLDIAREQGIGQEEILSANPDIDRWLPKVGADVVIPGQRLMPDASRKGIVINLPEYRLYYFPQPAEHSSRRDAKSARRKVKSSPRKVKSLPAGTELGPREVITFPISVGRMDWTTPIGLTHVLSKQKDPSWTPPPSIRAEHALDGDLLPQVVPPGPDNPLGAYALRLAIAGYLIHGTDKEFGVGMRVTHGCMRLLPEHIETLFRLVPEGTPVRLMNQPIKLGWGPDGLYVEAHPPLEEDNRSLAKLVEETQTQAQQKIAARPGLVLDEATLASAIMAASGMPVLISRANSVFNDSSKSTNSAAILGKH